MNTDDELHLKFDWERDRADWETLNAELDADEITKRATDDFVRMVPATIQSLDECATAGGFESAIEYLEMSGLHSMDELLSKIDYVMSGIGWEEAYSDELPQPCMDGNEIEWLNNELTFHRTFTQIDNYIEFFSPPMHTAVDGSIWLNSGLLA